MNVRLSKEPASPAFSPVLLFLLLLFFGSGCAALIYEIVWFQMLQLVIGSSAVSLGVLVGTYMGGMCLGSIVLPRIMSARRHPLRVYALLEFGIGLLGILILFGMPEAGRIYSAHVGGGLPGILLRRAVCVGLPSAADDLDGRDFAGHCPPGGVDAERRFLARVFLRRQHRRGGVRLPAGRILFAAGPRLGLCQFCGGGDQWNGCAGGGRPESFKTV